MSIGLLLALAAPALAAPALAAPPGADVHLGRAPTRLYPVDPAVQARLRHRPAWADFAAGEGAGWFARFDPATGTARRAWGPGIPLGPIRTGADAADALYALLARHPGLTGVPLADLPLEVARYVARTDTWYVAFARHLGGVPVRGGGVTARIRGERLLLLGIDTHPAARPLPPPRLGADEARAIAIHDGLAPSAAHRHDGARLVVLPPESAEEAYALTWEVRTRTSSPPGRWVAFVDAHTGALRSVHNEVRFLDGTVYATHDARTPDDDAATSPIVGATLTGSGGTVAYTDDAGGFSLPDDETFTAMLTGPALRVTNEAGGEGSLAVDDATPTWGDASATAAERDAWVFLQRARAFGLRFAPELPFWAEQVRAKVNVSAPCTAFYDGTLEFGIEGSGCSNLGRIADVLYHEWGHALHAESVTVGIVDGTLGEGVSDYIAALQTLDPVIAPSFYDTGEALREIASDRVSPDDLTGEIHEDGLVFAGAAWDLLGALQARYGEGPDDKGTAWAIAAQLLVDALKGGPELDTVFDEYVFADDDDGDLANGTPHLCEIVATFGAHGLGPLGDTFPATLAHAALANQPADTPIPLAATVRSLAPGCLDVAVAAVEARWSTDGTSWSATPLALADGAWSGALPAFPDGTAVAYRIVATGPDGDEVGLPAAEGAPYTFYVGALTPLWCADLASDDGGFTHAALEGVGPTADDWAFGAPAGAGDDPSEAFSGASVWGNDLGATDGAYPPNVRSRLYAPVVDTAGAERVVVQYRRWLAVGGADRARVLVNEAEAWSTSVETIDAEWMLHTLVIDAPGDTLALAWELDSGDSGGFGGWNVDDVCVSLAGAPPEDTGGDTAADSGGDTAVDTGPPGDTAADTGPTYAPLPPPEGCGCGGGGGEALPALVGAALLVGRRRRPRRP